MNRHDGYPLLACADCLEKAGGRQRLQQLIRWLFDFCGVCQRKCGVTDPVNFGNPPLKLPAPEAEVA